MSIRGMRNYSLENLEMIIWDDNRWKHFWEDNVTVDELRQIMYGIFIDSIDRLNEENEEICAKG